MLLLTSKTVDDGCLGFLNQRQLFNLLVLILDAKGLLFDYLLSIQQLLFDSLIGPHFLLTILFQSKDLFLLVADFRLIFYLS